MFFLTTIGAVIAVTPHDQVSHDLDESQYAVVDPSPFIFVVDGHLVEDDQLYGVYGPIIAGHKRYENLTCNILKRTRPIPDWREKTVAAVNFKIGPTILKKATCLPLAELGNRSFFYHPDGTEVAGFPVFSTYGEAIVLNDNAGEPSEAGEKKGGNASL